jgi:hypothetical protein
MYALPLCYCEVFKIQNANENVEVGAKKLFRKERRVGQFQIQSVVQLHADLFTTSEIWIFFHFSKT